ncbi:Zn-ribbon domain-containing OB-fold protein [Saccharopolyspora sp. NPDC050389]|uniref:Zn-ribbon domain-containing OB-fold protein n=1 Tax=Saccharopolyspora sp. NPDC050389 TaxID=3155516 RepID=UPI0033F2277E
MCGGESDVAKTPGIRRLLEAMKSNRNEAAVVGVDDYFQRSIEAGKFVIPRCEDCGRHHFYPRILCPHCGSANLRWVEPSGRGTVHSTTAVHRRSGEPYNVALVDLDEGPRLMTNVTGIEPAAVRIGMPVLAVIDTAAAAGPLLVFEPREEQ